MSLSLTKPLIEIISRFSIKENILLNAIKFRQLKLELDYLKFQFSYCSLVR